MASAWQRDAATPTEYHVVEAGRGREFILRLTTGADVRLAIRQFARDKGIRFAKIHAAFMGGLQPCRYLMWAPDTRNPANWHNEAEAVVRNLSMILAMSGMIHPRIREGVEEPCPAIHFVTGGAWDVPPTGGHLLDGTLVKGVFQIFITEILGIDVLPPEGLPGNTHMEEFPENWYRQVR